MIKINYLVPPVYSPSGKGYKDKGEDRDSQSIMIRYPNLLGRMFGKGNRCMGSERGVPLWLLHKLSPSIHLY